MYNALSGQLTEAQGTSFSAPATMHTAIGIKASLTSPLKMLALRALMSHHAERDPEMSMSEVGHGRFPQTVDEVLNCPDNEVRVIYQGTLQAGQNMRAPIPFPTIPLNGRVTLRATLCFSSHTDPEHAVNYTRAGLSVVLRPKKNVSKTMTFFSASKMYTTELEARTGEQNGKPLYGMSTNSTWRLSMIRYSISHTARVRMGKLSITARCRRYPMR